MVNDAVLVHHQLARICAELACLPHFKQLCNLLRILTRPAVLCPGLAERKKRLTRSVDQIMITAISAAMRAIALVER